jgi:hypothetical protein
MWVVVVSLSEHCWDDGIDKIYGLFSCEDVANAYNAVVLKGRGDVFPVEQV